MSETGAWQQIEWHSWHREQLLQMPPIRLGAAMIVLQKGGKPYRCLAAFLTDLDDERQADVTTKDQVLAFLKKRPDEQFLLVCDGEPTHEAVASDLDGAVFCGVVKWSSKDNKLHSTPLTCQS
jgi:hypothetical protein